MDSVELVKSICKERKIPISKLERDLDFSNGYIRRLKNGKFPSDRLGRIAEYLNVSINYLLGIPENSIIHDIQLRELFEAQLHLDGWEIEHYDPSEGKPCAECIARNEINGEPIWALPDGVKPEKLCDVCVLHDDKYILTKGDMRRSFTGDEYRNLINRSQNEIISSVLNPQKADEDKRVNRIPVLRRVAAGRPLEAVDEIIDWIEISESMARKGTYFGLLIKGNSMEPGIKDGDIVICREQPDAESGEVVVVRVDGDDGVCKRLKRYENGNIALMSDNSAYEPMYYDANEVSSTPIHIRGVVKELRRTF